MPANERPASEQPATEHPATEQPAPALLRVAAAVELVSLLVLLLNLATVHWAPVASLIGPVHGCAYLAVIGAAWRASPARRTRLLAFVPGIGGVLAARTAR